MGQKVKRCLCNFSFYDQQAIQEKLEAMAEKGWMLEKTGSFIWTYKRMRPKKLRFFITYFPSASEFAPDSTDGEPTKINHYHQDGWLLLINWGIMQIFYSENTDAIPIETEPITQTENVRRTIKKKVLFPQTVLCGIFVCYLTIRLSMWRRDPVGELSEPSSLYSVFMFGALILESLYEIGFYFYWSRKAKAVARNDGVFLPIQCRPMISWILLMFSALSLLLVCSSLFPNEKTVVGTYELYGRTREIYDDPLPLEIEELADVRAHWSKEADQQETFLLSSTEYRQYAVPVDGNDKVDDRKLIYTVTEVKWDFLYDFIKQAVVNAQQDEILKDHVFINHYEPIDSSVWNADDAYQLHWSNGVLDTYLICWGKCIVEITFYWEPTPEQIAIVAEKLRNFLTEVKI